MLTNKTIATAVLTALVGQAAAFNSHRHLHRQVEKQLDKRALETDWVTHWETVYVTAGQPQPTAESKPEENVEDKVAPPPAPEPTTNVVVEPSQPPAPPAQEKVAQPPAPKPTTLIPQVKPAEPSPEPEVEQPAPAPKPQPEPKPEEPKPSAGLDVDVGLEIGAPVAENPAKPSKTKEVDTPKPSEGSSSSGGAPFSSKRGIAYNDALLANLFGSSCESCSWAWNWGSSSSGLEAGVNFVPMLWGDAPLHTDHWDEDCEAAISSGSKAIFSFNEPDHASQAAIPAAQAAESHAKWMNKYSGQALVGSPSVTNSGNPGEGLEYLQAFMDACNAQQDGCAIDFCQVHWYSEAAYVDTLFEHIEKAHEICDGKPIWLTEFAPLDTDPAVLDDFMKTVIPKLDGIEYLDAYSYFMVSLDNLMSSSSALSTYGELYASV